MLVVDLTAELIKNIVLAGIKFLTLINNRNSDDTTVNISGPHSDSTPVSYGTATNEHLTLRVYNGYSL